MRDGESERESEQTQRRDKWEGNCERGGLVSARSDGKEGKDRRGWNRDKTEEKVKKRGSVKTGEELAGVPWWPLRGRGWDGKPGGGC